MAQRKKRSSSKKSSKKHSKTTKRQFLAAIPQAFPSGLLPAFSLPTAPFAGPASPVFPSFPLAQTQQPMAFRSRAFPTFQPKPTSTRLSGMKLETLGARRMPMMSQFSGFPYAAQNSPFVKVPQFQNANFFRSVPSNPWAPVRQSMSGKHAEWGALFFLFPFWNTFTFTGHYLTSLCDVKFSVNKCSAKFKLVTYWSGLRYEVHQHVSFSVMFIFKTKTYSYIK